MIIRLASTLTVALVVSVVGPVALVSSSTAPLAAVGEYLTPAAHASSTLTAAPACEYEDGSSQRVCVWDAAHSGNGIGRSVVIRHGGTDRGTVTFVSHRRAHSLIEAWEASH